jgi:hypothetical protein
MNFTVTGEPAPSQLDQKRKTLLQSMLSGGPGAQRLLGGGRTAGGYSASNAPNAAVPGLTFNPFLAQLQRGVSGLQAPTQQARQVVNDLTGAPAGGAPGGIPGGGAPAQAPAPSGGGAAPVGGPSQPTDLASAYAAAGINPDNLSQGNILGMFSYDPSQTPPPPVAPSIPFLRPSTRSGSNIAF